MLIIDYEFKFWIHIQNSYSKFYIEIYIVFFIQIYQHYQQVINITKIIEFIIFYILKFKFWSIF